MEKKNTKTDQFFLKQIQDTVPEGTTADPSRPDTNFKVDYVYGFAGPSSRNCLFFGKTKNELVYPAAALGIVHDIENNTQKFFGGAEKDKDAEKYLPNQPNH